MKFPRITLSISRKSFRRLIFSVFVTVFVIITIFFSLRLIAKLEKEEQRKIELWAMASKTVGSRDPYAELEIASKIIGENKDIPLILTDARGTILVNRNIPIPEEVKKKKQEEKYLRQILNKFKMGYPPIKISPTPYEVQYIYYADSYSMKELNYYTYVQLGFFVLLLLSAILVIGSEKRAERNNMWNGLSKETAHQLGTPISSLMAWIEILKMEGKSNPEAIVEIEKDINRLSIIADRFQKIGSIPDLTPISVNHIINQSVDYMRSRISNKVKIELHPLPHEADIRSSQALFSWVIENLFKNAVDAMQGSGLLTIEMKESSGNIVIDISDTGKGIPARNIRKIFRPGYTTKSRGWGLGLSLAKRVIQEYHNGKIFVKKSVIDEGTTFRIILPKVKKEKNPPSNAPSA